MANSTTRLPQRGDIVARTLGTRDNVYFKQGDFVEASLTPNTYEVLGVVAWRFRDQVLVVYKKNVSKKWCGRAWWYLSGFTLDGAEHSGIISIRAASNSWASNIEKTITYTANNVTELIAALNAAFAADSDFTAQDWYADAVSGDDTKVRVHCNNLDYRQCSSNTAKSGFALSGSLPEITSNSSMRRKNGGVGADWAISAWDKAKAYFGSKAAETLTGQAPIKTTGTPVAKATYLANANGYCDNIIARYGSGEAGYWKYLASCKPVRFTDYGTQGVHDGKVRTERLASFRFTSSAQATEKGMCDAADYCYNMPTTESLQTVSNGEFWLPTCNEIDLLLQDVKYGTSGSRNADELNAGLNKISGSTAIANTSYWWSCCRYLTGSAWCARGNGGVFNGNFMYDTFQALPVSLFTLK